MTDNIDAFCKLLRASLDDGTFVKLSLGRPRDDGGDLKNLYARRVTLKTGDALSFTARHRTKDIIKNFAIDDGIMRVRQALTSDFSTGSLMTAAFDAHLDALKNTLRRGKPSVARAIPATDHDHARHRHIETRGKSYLHDLGITDESGKILKTAQDKYRQIDKYIEIAGGIIRDMPDGALRRVVDMGAGKGYLTFALYDYITGTLGRAVEITGVEARHDLVDLCNGIAARAGFAGLRFATGMIGDYDAAGADMLIALHACDTATDDAIASGIRANAAVIIVAPCCHKQMRRAMAAQDMASENLSFILRHGIFTERQADMVTDSIRALILEYHGYRVKVFEFVSDAHTAKNIMITATRRDTAPDARERERIRADIERARATFGFDRHYLETLLPFPG